MDRSGAGAAAVEWRRTAAWFHLALAEGLAASLARLAEQQLAASSSLSAGSPPGGAQSEASPLRASQSESSPLHGSQPAGAPLGGSESQGSPHCGSVAIVLSGGCFQNALLLEATRSALQRRGHRVHWSEAVPGNDGGLALGQLEALRRDIRVEGR